MPDEVSEAIQHQMQTMPYAYPGVAVVDIRTKVAALLADMVMQSKTCSFQAHV